MNDWRIRCAKCGDMIGVWPDDLRELIERTNVHPLVRCPGKGNHTKPREVSLQIYWLIVEEFLICYPETDTREHAYRYIGPAWWPLVAIALCLLVKRNPKELYKKIRMSGKMVFWLPRHPAFWKKLKKLCSEQKTVGRRNPN